MKILLAFLLVFSFAAHAGNEGPQAQPILRQKLLAEYIVSIGFGPPTVPSYYKYQIYFNGYTQLVTKKRNASEPEVTPLKAYDLKDTKEIRSLVKEIIPGEITFPSTPGCMDGPIKTLKVYSDKGEIVIAKTAKCLNGDRENRSHADEKLINILTDLSNSRP